ncbi:hypothetical protein ACFO4O_00660 [Glaciecola siphonariae]|uniref:Uncharacterized protein n=1 Tax=Glaciecola siphonariae TaxID=521012 RepID=A0ABV9LR26_9ALTE
MSKGSRVKAQKQAQQEASLAASREQKAEQQDKPATAHSAFSDPKNINWVLISGAMALTVIVLLFLPQQLGAGITSVYSIMLWTGLFGTTLFRYMGKSGWIGFISGSVVGMLLHIFAPLLA